MATITVFVVILPRNAQDLQPKPALHITLLRAFLILEVHKADTQDSVAWAQLQRLMLNIKTAY